MATKTSAYGEEAKVLLIRELTPEVLEVLKWYKGKRGITANTVAALEIISNYYRLSLREQELVEKLHRLSTQYESLIYALSEHALAKRKIEDIVNEAILKH